MGDARCLYGSPHWSSTARVSWPVVDKGKMVRLVAACCYREERSRQRHQCRYTGVCSQHGSSRHFGRSCHCTHMYDLLIWLERRVRVDAHLNKHTKKCNLWMTLEYYGHYLWVWYLRDLYVTFYRTCFKICDPVYICLHHVWVGFTTCSYFNSWTLLSKVSPDTITPHASSTQNHTEDHLDWKVSGNKEAGSVRLLVSKLWEN